MSISYLDEIIQAQKQGETRGIASICSAHPWVLKTALQGDKPVLIESTCNQVNQVGGYTGMKPADFVRFVTGLAAENGFPLEYLILGGDHLGPSPWKAEKAEIAMEKAAELVKAYCQAGFTKIHLDASMKLGGDDPKRPLDLELAARRTAHLALEAEAAANPQAAPRYIIGTEVPAPGGAVEHEAAVSVTEVENVHRMLEVTRAAFLGKGLESAWDRVIAVVVQPGVEFGDDFVIEYDPRKTLGLVHLSETLPMVFEAHSTDYQTRDSLQNLVRDHFAILKVGPALTAAFREAVFSLAMMEKEMIPAEDQSCLIEIMEESMLRNPLHWKDHYHGTQEQQAFARNYSLSDRIRYYWPEAGVQTALSKMLRNLEATPPPLSLISQFLPDLSPLIREGRMSSAPAGIIVSRISRRLEDYSNLDDEAIP